MAAIGIVCGGFVGIRWQTGNLGTVEPGRIYRSAQLSADGLSAEIQRHGIKTVLNLRGRNPDQAWYASETRATLAKGATQVDFPMSSDQWLSHEQATTLLEILDASDYPILVHCEWGAERTGLVSAICRLLQDGGSMDQARREFSPFYMFLPTRDGLVMRGHLDAYQSWLDQSRRDHSPSGFRDWLTQAYQPGSPSREHWPCNPYPLKVISRPGMESLAIWGEKVCR